jgi:hypothetical protein
MRFALGDCDFGLPVLRGDLVLEEDIEYSSVFHLNSELIYSQVE